MRARPTADQLGGQSCCDFMQSLIEGSRRFWLVSLLRWHGRTGLCEGRKHPNEQAGRRKARKRATDLLYNPVRRGT